MQLGDSYLIQNELLFLLSVQPHQKNLELATAVTLHKMIVEQSCVIDQSFQNALPFFRLKNFLDRSSLKLLLLKCLNVLKYLVFSLLCLPESFFNDSLLLHALPPLLVLSILVPEAVKKDIFNLATSIVLSDEV